MSTQILTELPNIQKAGMDFNTVLEQMQDIINNNPNWKENFPDFYNSEAGVMLFQLMAWIADNMSTRQDLLYNEMFLGTAQKDTDKVRHLKQIGYVPQMPHSAKAKIKITLNKMAATSVIISKENPKDNAVLNNRVSQIASFESKDINGRSCYWEILKLRDEKPDYLGGIYLNSGSTEYWEDSNGNDLYAVQGKTIYEEFTSQTESGSYFNLREKDIAANSLRVYMRVGSTVKELTLVNSFISKEALDESKSASIPYVLEINEDLTYKIRFASKGLLKDSKLLPANSTISVFYRVSNGSLGNIKVGSINKETNYKDENGESYGATITNEYPGTGGSNKESLNDAVMNGPISLRTMDRAVTPEDYNVILERNTSVFKTKTYTASNPPEGFREYYGRFINPQESFSFIMLNKDHNGIPTSKFNSFPWITTIREPRINEKYIFDNANYNNDVKIGTTNYNITVNREGGKEEKFRNLTVLDLGEEFNNSLYEKDDEGNFIVDEKGNYIENMQLKAKITTKKTDEAFFKDIPFSLFSDSNYSVIKMNILEGEEESKRSETDVNLIMDDHARFVTRQVYDEAVPIDVINYRYLNFVLNDMVPVRVDLFAEKDPDAEDMKSYYLKWDNTGNQEEAAKHSNDIDKEAADYRQGIVELINKAVNTVVTNGEAAEFAQGSYQYFGLKNITDIDSDSTIPHMKQDDVTVELEVNKGAEGPKAYRFKFLKNYASFVEGEPGSLKLLENYLNHIFKNGSYGPDSDDAVEINNNGIWKKADPGCLSGYEAKIIEKTVFNTDDFDDDDESSMVRTNYDLVIRNKDKKVLTNYGYVDKYGYQHNLKNVVDVQDPLNIFTGELGLFQMVLNKTESVNRSRSSFNLPEPTQSAEYERIAYMIGESGTKRLKLSSPTTGSSSTIYLTKEKSANDGDFAKDFLKVYFEGDYSYKAYGIKKVHLLKKDPLSSYSIVNGEPKIIDINAHRGNILFENSCIYTESDFSNLYSSYSLNSNDSIEIGSSYENFYYVGGEKDEKLKRNVVGILGQSMKYTINSESGNKKYDIDRDKSKFNIKFTKEPEDTNSIFAIDNPENKLDVVGMDKVEVTSYDIKGPPQSGTLSFSIDDEPRVDVRLTDCNNAVDIIRAIKLEVKNLNLTFSKIKENIDTIVSIPFESINQLRFHNLEGNSDSGNIKFYYKDGASDKVYLSLFGTNITNSNFYKLYPKSLFKDYNIRYVDEENPNEYYYAPGDKDDEELTFTFRKLIEKGDELISKPADYYIDVQNVTNPITNITEYKFFLKKTKDSEFPENYFYMHFVNDKTYDFIDDNNHVRETDESILQNYMRKYKISGTDIIFLQPYFKTYDIAASIIYNINFNKSEVSKNVRAAIDNICDLQHSDIAGSISRAKIFKAIMNCDGVEDCKITYLGYDYENKPEENYEELKSKFYEIMCIHEDDNISGMHGKILTFDESGNYKAYDKKD